MMWQKNLVSALRITVSTSCEAVELVTCGHTARID
jgi:hypothetical protein